MCFDAGIRADVRVTSNGFDFTLAINGSTDSLRLTSAASLPATYGIERIEFSNETDWDDAALRTRYFADAVTSGNDKIAGWEWTNDVIDGGAGSDTLTGHGGDDTLRDGEVLFGGTGSDTYVFTSLSTATINEDVQASAHTDVIVMPSIVNPGQVTPAGSGSDLSIWTSGGHRIVVTNYFGTGSGAAQQIEEIRFADGTVWTPADMIARRIGVTEGDDAQVSGSPGTTPSTVSAATTSCAGTSATTACREAAATTPFTATTSRPFPLRLPATATTRCQAEQATTVSMAEAGTNTYRFGRGDGADRIVEVGAWTASCWVTALPKLT